MSNRKVIKEKGKKKDSETLKEKILEAYTDGSALGVIIESFNITHEQLTKTLLEYKEESKFKRTFTDEFRQMIADRDINGVARSTIASELEINISTVKKSCEQFGQKVKERAISENLYTRIDGKFSLKECPSCKSKKNNLVDERTTYCLDCGSEHEYYDGYVLRVNFEYLEG